MGENQLLVDTDVLIAYLNHRAYRSYLESARYRVFYSAITKKELLSKPGLKTSERQAILTLLTRFRLLRVDRRVTDEYSLLRARYTSLAKGDALIAASALARKLPPADAEPASLSCNSRTGLIACRSQTLAVARI